MDLERPVDTVVPPLFQYRRRFVDFFVLGHGLVCYRFQKSPEVVFRSRRGEERNCACWKLGLPQVDVQADSNNNKGHSITDRLGLDEYSP